MQIEQILENHPNLNIANAGVFIMISERIKNSGKNCCYYTILELVAKTKLSEKTLRNYIRNLVEEDLLTIKKIGRKNEYRLSETTTKPVNNTGNVPRQPENNTGNLSQKLENNTGINQTSNINNFKNINISEYQISDLSDPISMEYQRLRNWYGRQPLYIGVLGQNKKHSYTPQEVRDRMANLSPMQLDSVRSAFNSGHIDHHTAWIQAALMNPFDFAYPKNSIGSEQIQHQSMKPRKDKIHFNLEHDYDYDEIEANILDYTKEQNKLRKFKARKS